MWEFLMLALSPLMIPGYFEYKMGKEQKKIHYERAAILAQEAKQERLVAQEKAREVRQEAKRIKAKNIVRAAKSGLGVSSPTFSLSMDESMRQFERQAGMIHQQGQFAYQRKMSEAALEEKIGKAKHRAGRYRMFTSFGSQLSQGGQMAYMYGLG